MVCVCTYPPFILSESNETRGNSGLSDADATRFNISSQERADFMEEVTTELSVYLGMLYHMIEVFKGHDDFADELSKWQWFMSIRGAADLLNYQ
jgi:hypothetical protein